MGIHFTAKPSHPKIAMPHTTVGSGDAAPNQIKPNQIIFSRTSQTHNKTTVQQ